MTTPRCSLCGEHHEPHEDAKCGCSCGAEPMGCATCTDASRDHDKDYYLSLWEDDGRYDDDPNPYHGTYSEE